MGEIINASVAAFFGLLSVLILLIIVYKFIRQMFTWAKNIRF